ncbi:MAG TPA: replication-relaxation family protein [Acidimicrobiales bacterium]|nr:replication-relaxation family protein [Acidimicrobiales bacterium]
MARHRVLTSGQVTEMFFDSHKSALARLLGLYRLGVLDRFQPYRASWGSHPYHYVLGPAGTAVLAAEAFEDPERAARRWKPDRTVALGHTQRLAHLVGLNGFYASLAGHARRHPSARLVSWMTEAECARWSEAIVHPDGFGEGEEDGAGVEFFLEYDRGTETLARLVDKLADYERFESERGASAWVVFCFSSPRREGTARRALAGATVPIATAALSRPLGAAEAVWLPLGRDDGRRVRLAALGAMAKPGEALRRAAVGGPRAWRFERPVPDGEAAAPGSGGGE